MSANLAEYTNPGIGQFAISDKEFAKFKMLIYELAGISLSEAKKSLVMSRLSKRLRHHGLSNFCDYYKMVTDPSYTGEQQMMVDLLTTNETYFFREPKHFELLSDIAKQQTSLSTPFKVWSAAASSGEEAYTIAMTLDDAIGDKSWEILGTDISTRVLESARRGVYTMQRASKIPKEYMVKYCMKGVRSQEGMILVDKKLQKRVQFHHMNLLGEWRSIDMYDAIFLRNVMIYFDTETKQRLVRNIASRLKHGGYFFIGHSESLNGIYTGFKTIMPSVYQKV